MSEPEREKESNKDFFPLAIGNKWYYKSWDNFEDKNVYPDRIRMTEEVKTTIYLESKLFFLIEDCFLNPDGSIYAKDSIYYNISGDTLYQIINDWAFCKESLSIKAIFADTSSVHFKMKWYDDYYESYSRYETDTTINFVYYKPLMADSGSEVVFKKHVGICDYISYQTYGLKLVKYELY